ncbi:MAG: DUF3276 family protein [Saprospiraceae bacterium]|nr:DUF3276 family protein [Saprospiraceae bacterium]
MDEKNRRFESLFTSKVRAGRRRTYFFDVRETKGHDYYVTITESTRKYNGDGYERHKVFIYKEDFNRFIQGLQDAVNHVKTELLPDYDYDEFTRKQEEWERQKAEEAKEEANKEEDADDEKAEEASDSEEGETSSEEDMTW